MNLSQEDIKKLEDLKKIKISSNTLSNLKELLDFIGIDEKGLLKADEEAKKFKSKEYVCKGELDLHIVNDYNSNNPIIRLTDHYTKKNMFITIISLLNYESGIDSIIHSSLLQKTLKLYEYITANNLDAKTIFWAQGKEIDEKRRKIYKLESDIKDNGCKIRDLERNNKELLDNINLLQKINIGQKKELEDKSIDKLTEKLGKVLAENIKLKAKIETLISK
jgi:hypothetical protein